MPYRWGEGKIASMGSSANNMTLKTYVKLRWAAEASKQLFTMILISMTSNEA